jgi:hypothetical protein
MDRRITSVDLDDVMDEQESDGMGRVDLGIKTNANIVRCQECSAEFSRREPLANDDCRTTDFSRSSSSKKSNCAFSAMSFVVRIASSRALLAATAQCTSSLVIAVGTVIAHRPPRRPGRAQFGHPVLTLSV